MNANDSELRKRMRSLSGKIEEGLSEDDIYSSLGFRKYLLGLVETMKVPGLVNLILDRGKENGQAGCTDKNSMYINYMHRIVRRLETPEARFMSVLGLFYHECAHNKFCDFDEDIRIRNGIKKGVVIAEPTADMFEPQLIPAYLDLKKAIQESEVARRVVFETLKDLSNIVDDVHDENAMIAQFGDFVGESIYLLRSSLHEDSPSYEIMQSLMKTPGFGTTDLFSSMLLQLARFGYVTARDPENMQQDNCYMLADLCRPYLEKATSANDKITQYRYLWIIMTILWIIYSKLVDDAEQMMQMLQELSDAIGNGQGGDSSEDKQNGQSQGGASEGQEQGSEDQQQSSGASGSGADAEPGDEAQQQSGGKSGSGKQTTGSQNSGQSGSQNTGSEAGGSDPSALPQNGEQGAQSSDQSGSESSRSDQGSAGQTPDGQTKSEQIEKNDSKGKDGAKSANDFERASDDVLQQMLDALKKAAEQIGSNNNDANGRTSSLEAVQNRVKARKAPKEASEADRPQNDAQGSQGLSAKEQEEAASKKARDPSFRSPQMAAVAHAVATAEAEAQLTKINADALGAQVNAVDRTSPHEGVPLQFERVLKVTDQDRYTYDQIMAPLSATSKRLQKKLLEALRDIKEGYVTKKRHTGRIFCPNDAYRPDQRYFANKKLPEDFPDMAISVLVDHSGSMNGKRIEAAQKASMLLYDFAVGLGIPVSVAGHYTSGKKVYYRMYTEFDKFSKEDRYRLSQMGTGGCNRDGLALNVAIGLLMNRPEDVKLLIIISDGQPNHDNYGGLAAAEDIQQIVRDARKHGVEVMAAAIGSDRDTVGQIYTDGFLDIADLNELPRTLVNIVKNRIIRNAF